MIDLETIYSRYMNAKPSAWTDYGVWRTFIRETLEQFNSLASDGWTFGVMDTEPYLDAESMFRDMERKHLTIYTGGQNFAFGHPLDVQVATRFGQLSLNEIFRAVHDINGHLAAGSGFDLLGETLAWQAHRKLYSSAAWPALDAETIGQVAYFTKNGEFPNPQPAKLIYL